MFGKKLKYILLGLSSLVLAGCIKEDMSGCNLQDGGIALKFRYADVREGGYAPQTDRLSVFIFDQNGIFVARQTDSPIRIDDDYAMRIGYTQGKYQFVVWAGLPDQSYGISDCVPGVTRIEDLKLSLRRDADSRIAMRPALLYHAYEAVEAGGPEEKVVWIDLWRMTNDIRVITYDLGPDYTIQIDDDNGLYDSYGDIMSDEQFVDLPRYVDAPEFGASLIVDFTVMKLASGRTPRLKILDAEGVVRYDKNLVGELIGANPSVDFRYDHDFLIEITFSGYVAVSVRINGWELIDEEV